MRLCNETAPEDIVDLLADVARFLGEAAVHDKAHEYSVLARCGMGLVFDALVADMQELAGLIQPPAHSPQEKG